MYLTKRMSNVLLESAGFNFGQHVFTPNIFLLRL